MTNHNDYDIVENRSEIVFLYDAVDTNPNGNPLSASNRPRIDQQTGHAIVTDVRLKRYIRDQLIDDDHGVFIRNVRGDDDYVFTREELVIDRISEDLKEQLRDGDPDEDNLGENVFYGFIDASSDVRLFGATLSIDTDDADNDVEEGVYASLPSQFTGPVQFSPARSLNAPVEENENYNSLTSVIGTGDGKEQGGYDLDDHRLKYALMNFGGVVDENAAEDTLLEEEDVQRLDTVCWRAIKNQTITRSKVGQTPRLYVRVEYSDDAYHIGGLNTDLSVDEERSSDPSEMRSIEDVTVDVTQFIEAVTEASSRIDTIHVKADRKMSFSLDGEAIGRDEFIDSLAEVSNVHEIDVYDEYPETLPQ